MNYSVSYIRDGLIMFVIIYCYTVLSHTILRAYLKDFLYSLKYSILTFFVFLVLSCFFLL